VLPDKSGLARFCQNAHDRTNLHPLTRLFLLCLLLPSCSRREPPLPLISPSGNYRLTTEVPGKEAGPTRRYCLRLKVTDLQANREMRLQTGASDFQKWAVAWSTSNTLVLYSSDVGTKAYDIKSDQILERDATNTELDVGDKAYEKRFGKLPSERQERITRAEARIKLLRERMPEMPIIVLVKQPELSGNMLDIQDYKINGESVIPLFSTEAAVNLSLRDQWTTRTKMRIARPLFASMLHGNEIFVLDPQSAFSLRFTAAEFREAFPESLVPPKRQNGGFDRGGSQH